MGGFVRVTDNDWFAEVTLLKQDWHKAQGVRLTALRSNWAKARMRRGGQAQLTVSGKGQLSVRLPTCIGSTHCPMLVPTSAASFRRKVAFLKCESPSLFSCDIWLHFSYMLSQSHASKGSGLVRGIPNTLVRASIKGGLSSIPFQLA